MLAPDCDEHGAYMLAERIRAAVHEALSRAAATSQLTISFGIATFPLHGQSADGLLRAADQALYAAKRLGRNRSVISSAEVPGILARAPRGADGEAHVELAALLNLAEALDVRDTGSAIALPARRPLRRADRARARPAARVRRARAARRASCTTSAGWRCRTTLLAKQGPLTEDEWAWVRAHPEIGARMVETTEYEDIRSWILFHHERPDGRGYPRGPRRGRGAARGARSSPWRTPTRR